MDGRQCEACLSPIATESSDVRLHVYTATYVKMDSLL
jgi:hypothetical protein